jgi:hypothetical protein
MTAATPDQLKIIFEQTLSPDKTTRKTGKKQRCSLLYFGFRHFWVKFVVKFKNLRIPVTFNLQNPLPFRYSGEPSLAGSTISRSRSGCFTVGC